MYASIAVFYIYSKGFFLVSISGFIFCILCDAVDCVCIFVAVHWMAVLITFIWWCTGCLRLTIKGWIKMNNSSSSQTLICDPDFVFEWHFFSNIVDHPLRIELNRCYITQRKGLRTLRTLDGVYLYTHTLGSIFSCCCWSYFSWNACMAKAAVREYNIRIYSNSPILYDEKKRRRKTKIEFYCFVVVVVVACVLFLLYLLSIFFGFIHTNRCHYNIFCSIHSLKKINLFSFFYFVNILMIQIFWFW